MVWRGRATILKPMEVFCHHEEKANVMNGWAASLAGLLSFSATTVFLDEQECLKQKLVLPAISVDTVVCDLMDPVGIAVDPLSGTVFVAEPGAGRIVIVQGKAVVGSFRTSFRVCNESRCSSSNDARCRARWTYSRLRSPVDVACDKVGRLFIAESAPGGRILLFDVRRRGFSEAVVVACPPADETRVYSCIGFDDTGRLCAISYDVGGRNPEPRVEIYTEDGGSQWEQVEQGSDFLGFPFASTKVPARGQEANRAVSAPDDPVLEWLYSDPAFGRMTVDPASGHVYATMRGKGTVVKVQRTRP